MITIKDKQARIKMAATGKLLSEFFQKLEEHVVPGVSTLALDVLIENYLKSKNMISQSKGYQGYGHASCISINDEVVHGVPSARKILKEGDLVKVDICAAYDGYCADMARCFFVGAVTDEVKKITTVASAALNNGIEKVVAGGRLGDICNAIQVTIEKAGYGIVRDFAGHGIGRQMHEEPEILNYGKTGSGPLLRVGMAFAIEPMIAQGSGDIFIAADGWTVKTVDGSIAAHVEDTVIVTEHGPEIITRL